MIVGKSSETVTLWVLRKAVSSPRNGGHQKDTREHHTQHNNIHMVRYAPHKQGARPMACHPLGESPSNLRIAEVLKKEEELLVKLWYYVDRTVKNYDNAELTPGLRRVVPEWYKKSTGQII